MIWAHDGHAECCLKWNVYNIALALDFKLHIAQMNVITKISC